MDNASIDAWNALHDAVMANDDEGVAGLIQEMRENNMTDATITAIINRTVTLSDLTDNDAIKDLLRQESGNIIQEAGSKKRGRRSTKRHAKKRRATKRRTH